MKCVLLGRCLLAASAGVPLLSSTSTIDHRGNLAADCHSNRSFIEHENDEVAALQVLMLSKKAGVFRSVLDLDQATPDGLAYIFAVVGGLCVGTSTVPFKAPSVMKAQVHPVIFLCYKTFWSLACAVLVIISKIVRNEPYVFGYWGVIAAAFWIPASLFTIVSVQKIGVGLAAIAVIATCAIFEFVGGHYTGERMKQHNFGNGDFALAPLLIAGVVLGMIGLVLSQFYMESLMQETGQEAAEPSARKDTAQKDLMIGLVCGVCSGFLNALQVTMIPLGKMVESAKFSCADCPEKDRFINEFDSFGSYFLSFNIGLLLMTPLWFCLFVVKEKCAGKEMPQSHFEVLRVWGSISGVCWTAARVFDSAAVNRGGVSTLGPAVLVIANITCGSWALLYYREVKHPKSILCWVLSAVCTVSFVILLGREVQK